MPIGEIGFGYSTTLLSFIGSWINWLGGGQFGSLTTGNSNIVEVGGKFLLLFFYFIKDKYHKTNKSEYK